MERGRPAALRSGDIQARFGLGNWRGRRWRCGEVAGSRARRMPVSGSGLLGRVRARRAPVHDACVPVPLGKFNPVLLSNVKKNPHSPR